MLFRDILKLVEEDGWTLARQKGSNRHVTHPNKPGIVTIAGHPSKEVAPKTLNSILK